MRFVEEGRARAEAEHRQNPHDAQVLARWGGALLELAHFRQGPEAVDMIEEAVESLRARWRSTRRNTTRCGAWETR